MRKVQQLLGVGSVFALAAGGAFAGLTASSVAGAEPTTFDTAGVSSFAVPAGVCSVTIMASGAAGGGVGLLATGINNDGTPSDNVNAAAANAGGVGAAVTATVTVTPGETLAVQVGGAGGSTGVGGVGGGGGGASNGGGGGGASVVSGSTGPLVVAGGGGGGGASVGGNAGTLGQAGTDGGGSGGGHGGSSAGVGGNGASDGGGFGGGAGGGVNGGGTGDGGGAGGTGAAGVGGGGGGGGNTATPGGAGGTGGTGTGSGGTGTLGGAQGGLGNSTGGDGGGGSSAIQSGGGGGGGIGFGGGGGGMGGAGDGGGGAGYGGGGGGGASGPAGGGGGGTSFVAPGAFGTSSALSELTDGQVTITPGAPGVGCPSTLQVQKLVSGPSTTGFTEHVACTAPAIDSAVTTTVASVDLPVNADGTPDGTSPPAGWSVVDGKWQSQDAALVGATCTLTETATGGATSVSYACAWTAGSSDHLSSVGCPGAASGPSATAPSVTFEGNGDVGVLTVTNTFPAAPIPAAAIVAAPHFTG